jgi:argininosuccinate lyase
MGALSRDIETASRLWTCQLGPLGAGALATTSFDKPQQRGTLGFDAVLENSIDAVGSRDYILKPSQSGNTRG